MTHMSKPKGIFKRIIVIYDNPYTKKFTARIRRQNASFHQYIQAPPHEIDLM